MKKKKKKKALLWCCAALALLMCLIPQKHLYKDGGTVEYRALLYRVTQWHALIESTNSRPPRKAWKYRS